MKKEILEEKVDELCDMFLRLNTRADCRALLSDLCTYKEVEQMALRAYAAKLFLNGKTYIEIISETELSSATISRVSRSVTHGCGAYEKFGGDA